MSPILKISVLGICCAVCTTTLRRHNAEFSVLLTVVGCCLGGFFLLELLDPVLNFVRDLFSKTGLAHDLLAPLLKTTGVGIITQISSSVCQDAGESALAKIVEFGGTVLCICLSLPLLSAVLTLVQKMVGE